MMKNTWRPKGAKFRKKVEIKATKDPCQTIIQLTTIHRKNQREEDLHGRSQSE
jgi:hypothetical protein